jgi:hypothetical protein
LRRRLDGHQSQSGHFEEISVHYCTYIYHSQQNLYSCKFCAVGEWVWVPASKLCMLLQMLVSLHVRRLFFCSPPFLWHFFNHVNLNMS